MSPLSRIQRLRARRLGRRAIASIALLAVASVVGIVGGLASLAAGDPASIIVRFDAGTTVEQRDAAIAAVGGTVVDAIPVLRMVVVEVAGDEEYAALSALRADDIVTSADPDRPREAQAAPNDPNYDAQWALDRIGWNDVYGSVDLQGTSRLAVLDTGVDANDPDLADRIIPGWSAFEGETAFFDPNGHGTALASIAASVTDNGEGIAGVAYGGVEILPVQVLDGTGVGQDADIIEGLVWAVDHGADVALMGFSSTGYSSALQAAVEYAWTNDVVVVAAVGNDGDDLSHFPAAMAKVVGVSATDRSDERWSGSNFGSSVFMAAPGVGIESVLGPVTGTSPAAAIVAGAAALLQAVDPGADPGVIVGRLARNADPVASTDDVGNGILDLAAAVADEGTQRVVPVGGSPVGDGGPYVTYTAAATFKMVSCSDSGTATAGTTFSTAEGAASATKTIKCRIQVNATSGSGTSTSYSIAGNGTNPASVGTGATCTFGTDDVLQASGTYTPVSPTTASYIDVDVTICGDSVIEMDETFAFSISGSTAGGQTTSITVTITNDDGISFSTAAASVTEVNTGSTSSLVFTVTKTGAGAGTVTYATSNGTALAGACPNVGTGDYTATSGTLTFLAADATKTITVPVCGDAVYEANETLSLTLSSASPTSPTASASVTGTNPVTGTITADSDAAPTLSIAAASVLEGSTVGGQVSLVFTVTKTGSTDLNATVDFATASGTATSGVDFLGTSGSLTFLPSEPSKTITVTVYSDTEREPDETLTMTLSNPSGATITGTNPATGTITNDDSGIAFSVACQTSPCESQAEGTTFTRSIGSVAATQASGDTTLSLTLGAGVTLPPSGAEFYILVESEVEKVTSWTGAGPYTLTVVRAQQSTSAARHASGTVYMPGGSATGGTYLLKISADGNVTGTVKYETVVDPRPGQNTATIGAPGAVCADGVDVVYAGATSTPVSLSPPTTTTQNFTITICKDGAFERTETFAIKVYDAATAVANASASPSGANASYLYLTITNDELTPSLVVSDGVPTNEGDSGTTNLSFTVTRWGPSEVPTNGTFAVTVSGASPANASDFVGATFPSGAVDELGTSYNAFSTVSLTVPIQGDLTPERGETFDATYSLNLASVGTATPLDTVATGTILNDDTKIVITPQGSGATESGEVYSFAIRLYNAHLTPNTAAGVGGVTLTYTASNSSATCTGSVDVKPQTLEDAVRGWNDRDVLYVSLCDNVVPQADRTITVTFDAINAAFSGVGANVKTFQIYDDDKKITAKVVRDSNLNGYEDSGDTALGGVGLRLFVDGVNSAGDGADTFFDPSSDFELSPTTTGTTKATLGIGVFSGLRNLTYFVVETDPTGLGPIASVGVTQGCGGVAAATVPSSMTTSVTPITVSETVAPTVALPVIRCIDSEQVSVTARTPISGSSYSYAIARGANGTTPATHVAGSTLFRPFASVVDATGIYKNNVIRVAFDSASADVSGATVANKFLDVLTQASIAGSVLLDESANGTLERAETSAVQDAVVQIFRDANGNGTFDPGVDSDTNPVTGAKLALGGPEGGLTDAYGAWSFTGLVGGTYFVVETDPTAGTICTAGVCQGTTTNFGSTAVGPTPAWAGLTDTKYRYNVLKVVLASGTTVSTGNNFLDSVATATISGRIVDDENANNLDDGESGLAATVKLYRDTNANGTYEQETDLEYGASPTAATFSFGSLLRGTYFLIETDLAGYASTVAIAGTGTNTSTVVPTEAWAQAITPVNYLNNALKVTVSAAGAVSTENRFLDALAGSSITAGVFDDLNANGLIDVSETARLAGATLRLFRDNPTGGTANSYDAADFPVSTQTTTTALTTFSGLVRGTYFIQETNPTNFQSTGFVTDATIGGVVASSSNDQIRVTVSVNGTTYGEHRFIDALAASTVSGAVTEDVNGDAIYDAAGPDRPLRGAVLKLYRDNGDGVYNAAGAPDAQVGATQTTTLAGTFSFGSLMAGTYWVVETNPGGFTSTNALATGVGSNIESSPTNAVTAGTDLDQIKVVIAPYVGSSSGGRTSAGNRFLDNSNYSIAGTVFNDANVDLSSVGDAGKDLVTVTLYEADGTTMVGLPVTSAGANPVGGFGFGNIRTGNALPPGTYVLAVTAPVTATAHWKSTQAVVGTGSSTRLSESRLQIVIGSDSVTATSTSNEFLITRDDYEIAGLIIDDSDASRAVNGAEGSLASPAASITIYRDANANGTLEIGTDLAYPSVTSVAGAFSVTGLTAGTYFIDESGVPIGYKATNAVLGSLVTSGGGNSATGSTYVSDTRLKVVLTANGNIQMRHTDNRFLVSDASRSIYGDVVEDLDADGEVDGGEGGLAGATVTLYRDNPSAGTAGVYDNADLLISAAPATTTAGTFSWTGLVTGRYFVLRVNPVGSPAYVSTVSIAGTGTTAATESYDRIRIDLPTTVGASNTGNRFLAAPATYSISGVVYNDADGSGSVTETAPGQPEVGKGSVYVTLTLTPNRGTWRVLADSTGVYTIPNLIAGTYEVTVADADLPTGWARSPQPNTSPSRWTRTLTLAGGLNISEGLVSTIGTDPETAALYLRAKNASVSGSLYGDLDGSGTYSKTAGDTLIAGATVVLFLDANSNGDYDVGEAVADATATTTASGAFQINNLYANTNYRLTYLLPPNYVNVLGTSKVLTVSLSASQAASGKNFFTQLQSKISGLTSIDLNADSLRAANSPPLAGVTVQLWRESDGTAGKSAGDTSIGTVTTGDDGSFTFAGLNSQSKLSNGTNSTGIVYYLRQITAPSTYSFTGVVKGSGTTVVTLPVTTQEIKVTFTTSGTTSADNYVLNTRDDDVTISGTIYDDLNANGIVDSATKIQGATVAVFLDGGNGTYDAAGASNDDTQIWASVNGGSRAVSAPSAADGAWSLGDLPTGTYWVVETDKAGYSSTASAPGTWTNATTTTLGFNVLKVVATAANATSTGSSFLDTANDNGTISGFVYDDKNADGVNGSSNKLGGAVVEIYREYDGTPGKSAGDILLNAITSGTTRTASVETTSGNSAFSFGGLPNGTFYVVETDPTSPLRYTSTKAIVGTGSQTTTTVVSENSLQVVLNAGASGRTNANNIFLDTRNDEVSISGRFEDDLNGNGAWDAGVDAGLVGATVTVYLDGGDGTYSAGAGDDTQMYAVTSGTTRSGSVTLEATSAAWSLGGLPAGTYWVRLVSPSANYVPTATFVTDATSYTEPSATTKVLRFTSLPANATRTTTRWRAALGNNSVAGFSYFDINGNGNGDFTKSGKNTKSDSPLEGTLVYLYRDADGDAAYNPSNDTLVTTNSAGTAITNPRTTPADGTYSFGGLLPGIYFLVQDPPQTADLDFVPTGADTPSACTAAAAVSGWAASYTVCSEISNSYPKRSPAPRDVYVRVVVAGQAQVALTNVYLLAQGGDLSVSITDGVGTVVAGGDLDYTVGMVNVGGGSVPTGSSTITVVLPSGVELISANGCSLSGSTVTCANDRVIRKDETESFTLRVHVSMDYAGTSLTMKAKVDAPAFDFNLNNNWTDVGYYDILSSVGTTATAFDNNDLSFRVNETSDPSPVPFDVLVDNEQIRISGRACSTLPCTYSIQTTPTNGRAQNGSNAAAHNTVGVSVLKVASIPADVNTVTRTSPLSLTTALYGGAGIWTGHTTDAGTVVAGTDLVYEVTASNAGPSSANFKVTTVLRASGAKYSDGKYCVGTAVSCGLTANPLSFASWSSIPSSGGTAGVILDETVDGQYRNAGARNWINGTSKTIFVRVKVLPSADPATISVASTMKSAETGSSSATSGVTWVQQSSDAEATIVARADVHVSLTAPGTVPAGSDLQYTFVVSNSGPSDARSVEVFEALDGSLTGTKYCVDSGGPACSAASATPWTASSVVLGTVAAESSGTVYVWATVPSSATKGSEISSEALGYSTTTPDWSVDALTNESFSGSLIQPLAVTAGADSIPDNNIDSAKSVVRLESNLGIAVTGMTASPVYGEAFTYSLIVTNNGPSDAPNVVVNNGISGLQSVGISIAGRDVACETSGLFPCNIGTVGAAAGTKSVTLVVTAISTPTISLVSDVPPVLTNTASVTSLDPDPIRADQSEDLVDANDSAPVSKTVAKRPTSMAISGGVPSEAFLDDTATVTADLDDLLGSATYQSVIDGGAHSVQFRSICGTGVSAVPGTPVTVQTSGGVATAQVPLDARAGDDCAVEVTYLGGAGKVHAATLAANQGRQTLKIKRREVTLAYGASEFIQMSGPTAVTPVPLQGTVTPVSGFGGIRTPVVDFIVTPFGPEGAQLAASSVIHATITENKDGENRVVSWSASAASLTGNISGMTWQIEMSIASDTNYIATSGAGETFFVTLFYPTAETYAAGGGWIRDPSPDPAASLLSITRNDKISWAFNVKYRKGSTTAPQGSFVLLIRADNGRTYKVKNTNWNNGLLTFPTRTQAVFKGNAVVQVTDTLTGATILDDYYSGRPVVFRIDVSVSPSTGRRISIWIYRESGGKFVETFYKAGGGTIEVTKMLTLGGGGMLIKP